MKETIINIVNRLYGIDGNLIFQQDRHQDIVLAKQMVMCYLRLELKVRLMDIANFLNVHHSVIVHGIRKYKGYLDVSKVDKEKYSAFKSEMESSELNMDFFVISRVLRENREYMSSELKEYLKVRL